MKREKHKKDYHPKKPERAWQGWMRNDNRVLRKILKNIGDVPNNSAFKKIKTWFEWN